jgi:hypothetical protein
MDFEFNGYHKGAYLKLRLHGTELDWQLQKQSVATDDDGNKSIRWRSVYYYTSLKKALSFIAHSEVRQAETIAEAVASIEAIGQAASDALEGLLPDTGGK